jgi:hypothetical protein
MSVDLQRPTQREIPEDRTHNHRCENLHRARVFENRMFRKISALKRDEIIQGRKKLLNKFRNFYSPPNTIRVSLSRRIKWAGHVARVGTKRSTYRYKDVKKREH